MGLLIRLCMPAADFILYTSSAALRRCTGALLVSPPFSIPLHPPLAPQAFSTEQQHAVDQDLNDFYRLRFLSNVDPVDVRRTLYDLDPQETIVIVISKTFTTAETMLNARTARQWLWDAMGKVRARAAHEQSSTQG